MDKRTERKDKENPEKYPDYMQVAGLVYRHKPHREGASWKL